MDKVFIERLAVTTVIGVYAWERDIKQTIYIDLEMPANASRAAATDDIDQTVDYHKIVKAVVAYAEASKFKLVETLAVELRILLKKEFALPWVDVVIHKPSAIDICEDVGIALGSEQASENSAVRQAYVGVASNDQALKKFAQTFACLRRKFSAIRHSTLYWNADETGKGADYLNGVVSFKTTLSATELMADLKRLEIELGRGQGKRENTVVIDLDLLFFSGVVEKNATFALPRPGFERHPYMLRPLAEFAGDELHPSLALSFAELWSQYQGVKPKMKICDTELLDNT